MQIQLAAASSGMELTPLGLAYCARHGRQAIERRIERHLALVTALLAIIDDADADPDLEPSLGWTPYCDRSENVDLEGGDVNDEGEAVNEDGTDLDNGELDHAESDSGWAIPGGDLALDDLTRNDRRRMAWLGYRP